LNKLEKENHKFEEKFTLQTKDGLLFLAGFSTTLCASS
jgi:hypothetical protein